MSIWRKPLGQWAREDYYALSWQIALAVAAGFIGRLIGAWAARH